MKIAVVPIELSWLSNREYPDRWLRLKDIEDVLAERCDGSEINLVSNKKDLLNADWIVFIGWYAHSYKWYKEVLANNLLDKTIYWMLEPGVVNTRHNEAGTHYFLKRFKYLMTWDRKLVDSKRIFKLNMPYRWIQYINKDVFEKNNNNGKMLLTSISGDKTSLVEGELYSERKRIIRWFDKNHPEDFMFYGTGWNISDYKTCGGICGEKIDVYKRFKFALCLENMSTIDYIDGKIMDCLTAGIVPIYKGAPNITEYIPENCFIDYNKFHSIEELYLFIKNMSSEDYSTYIKNIHDFVLSGKDIKIFSAREWVRCFEHLNEINKNNPKFEISAKEKIKFIVESCIFMVKLALYRIKEKLLR